ncbi:CRISPR-associated protein, TM1812 family [Methanocaldococcus vulcanius M7]|uniref:CRISPR-associated protein, TM1812 family n=1 Tax=Methanocaldococcus vulcanius (strain ATCC 700851 / DSM 12094 / M7) TaxID=579137 RepID=C9RHF1_METVM|nr:TIGR02221 family CRISPR-associated protein [Methanocaldococcus vulcanius]ACX73003.1 CRISPR-associated protein, TM1812 family [Methanocaldococcus vulcanius M7]
MLKVLIAPLGVGKSAEEKDVSKRKYNTAKYVLNGEEETSPFILSILTKTLKVDKVIVVGTARSMWEELYRYYANEVKEFDKEYWIEIGKKVGESKHSHYALSENDLKKVEEVIDKYLQKINKNATGGSKCKIIKYGINREEIWENFDIFMGLIDEINEGDEIYLDITHAFRSIPLFMYVMLEFMRYFKNVKLKGIYYGMLDVMSELGYAPVVDLSPIFEISEWVRGMYEFTTYGNGYLISELLEEEDKEIANRLKKISQYIDANFLKELKEEVKDLKPLIDSKKNKGKFLKYFIPELQKFVNKLNYEKSDFDFQISMAKWNFENKKYSSGYMCLTDSIFWKMCNIYNLPPIHENREIMKGIIYNPQLQRQHSDIKAVWDLHYNRLRDKRNKIAHADVSKGGKGLDPEKDLNDVIKVLEDMKIRNMDDIIKELLNTCENDKKTFALLIKILKSKIVKKVIDAYNLNDDENSWNFVKCNLLHKENRCSNENLKKLINLFNKEYSCVDELKEAFQEVKRMRNEDIVDLYALQNALIHYIAFKLSKAYKIRNNAEYKKIFKWMLLNKSLCQKNPILEELNKNYFIIFKNMKSQNPDSKKEIISASKNIINLFNKDISNIKMNVPLNVVLKAYNRYKNFKNIKNNGG